MPAFLFRLCALAIRFLCPLAALALSSAETMGKYYLFISYFTFVVGVSALELAVPFSRKYLRCRADKHRRLVFSGFLANQVVVTLALSIPAGVLVSSWAGVPPMLIPLFCLSLATEASVNEVGRFFWNIGEWQMPSLRDLIRALIFATAIVGPVYFQNEVLTTATFLTITAGNLCIIGWEWKSWGRGRLRGEVHPARILRSAWFRVKRSLAGSLPQFAHMQILGLQPLLERTLVEKSLGLAAVGGFSFLTSIMQSAAGLQLVPMIAKARQRLLGARTIAERIGANRQVLALLLKISAISGVWALSVHLTLPLLQPLMGKEIPATPFLILIAYVSSVSAIFCSAVAPLLTAKGHAWAANGLTLLVIAPLLVAMQMYPATGVDALGPLAIGAVALVQLMGRVIFITWDSKRLTRET